VCRECECNAGRDKEGGGNHDQKKRRTLAYSNSPPIDQGELLVVKEKKRKRGREEQGGKWRMTWSVFVYLSPSFFILPPHMLSGLQPELVALSAFVGATHP